MIQRCGKSGVELHEIRRNVNADGEDTTSKGKPLNGYTDGKRKQATKGMNCDRPRSRGVGMGPAVVEVVIASLLRSERDLLITIHAGKPVSARDARAVKVLVKKGLIEKDRSGWTYTYEGDQAVRKLKA